MAKGIGTLGLTHELQRQVVLDVVEEAKSVKQAAYDTVMELLSEPPSQQELDELMAQLTGPGMLQLMAERPDVAKEIMKKQREQMVAG